MTVVTGRKEIRSKKASDLATRQSDNLKQSLSDLLLLSAVLSSLSVCHSFAKQFPSYMASVPKVLSCNCVVMETDATRGKKKKRSGGFR